MTAENFALFNSWVGEDATSSLCVGPILTGKGDASAHPFAQSTEQITKSPPERRIFETGDIDFPPDPMAFIRAPVALLCRPFAPRL
jgi:hypothetical protein